jgi:hypothetical protein
VSPKTSLLADRTRPSLAQFQSITPSDDKEPTKLQCFKTQIQVSKCGCPTKCLAAKRALVYALRIAEQSVIK